MIATPSPPGIQSVLVANRGEVALRIYRACRELGIATVGVYSEADRDAPWLAGADRLRPIGPAQPSKSYLNLDAILEAADLEQVDAVHPGYGFLAERADFAQAVIDRGLIFVGPSPHAISVMGDKVAARRAAADAGCPILDAWTDLSDVEGLNGFIAQHGFPLLVKAAFGGGGRGMRVVEDASQMQDALSGARRESAAAFGRDEVYVEPYLARPRHVEVQVLADQHGATLCLGDRDCSTQRRHQKLIEEAPAPGLSDSLRAAMADASIEVSRSVGYEGLGTLEFLVDGDQFWFLEMNTRLQVEHPVTEMVTGIDLVHWQLRVAAGEQLDILPADIVPRGHAIEVRINAEDVANGFQPTPGTIATWRPPSGPGVRVDAAAEEGWQMPHSYDSLLAKLIVLGSDRETARLRMLRALGEFTVAGVPTTADFHHFALAHDDFRTANISTTTVESEWDLSDLVVDRPLDVASESASVGSREATADAEPQEDGSPPDSAPQEPTAMDVVSPMQGTIVAVEAGIGDDVASGDVVLVIEAMKMENRLTAHRPGRVAAIFVDVGDVVDGGVALLRIEGRGEGVNSHE